MQSGQRSRPIERRQLGALVSTAERNLETHRKRDPAPRPTRRFRGRVAEAAERERQAREQAAREQREREAREQAARELRERQARERAAREEREQGSPRTRVHWRFSTTARAQAEVRQPLSPGTPARAATTPGGVTWKPC